MPMIGTRKLYYLLKGEFETRELKIGRDKLIEILRKSGKLIIKKRKYVQTTNSKHWLRKYPNLLRGKEINQREQVWVSDITYIRTDDGFCYLTLVTDAYSRKVMGYDINRGLSNEGTIKAIEMAIKNRLDESQLIHHSDRGLQYCSREYVELLKRNRIKISMTEKSDPYENALAERMNRTIKEEFLIVESFRNYEIARQTIEESIKIYNNERPHLSCRMFTPEEVHGIKINPIRATPSWG